MKKSEMYRLAQCGIVNSIMLSAEKKLEILRVLMEDEDLALYCEEQEAKQAQAVNADETV